MDKVREIVQRDMPWLAAELRKECKPEPILRELLLERAALELSAGQPATLATERPNA